MPAPFINQGLYAPTIRAAANQPVAVQAPFLYRNQQFASDNRIGAQDVVPLVYAAAMQRYAPQQTADYNMAGFMRAYMDPTHADHARASAGPSGYDGQMHFTDYWKNPGHRSFSADSQYAQPTAPRWFGSGDEWSLYDRGQRTVVEE